MFVVSTSRGIGAVALAAGLLLAGCSSDSDVPPTVVSAPDGGTQMNTDTGSGGEFPDVNTTPTQRPTSTIQDLAQAPTGLAGAPRGTQYGEALVGGPTSTAEPPAPPPPPEPPQEALAPIPEPGVQTESSDVQPSEPYSATATEAPAAEPPSAPNEPVAAPEIVEPQPMEPVAAPEPAVPAGEGQTIYGSTPEPSAPEPVVAAPEPTVAEAEQPVTTPEQFGQPAQPDAQPAPAPVTAPQQAQLPAGAPSPNGALAPEAYGVAYPQPNQAATVQGAAPAAAPAAPTQTSYGGEPVGLIYFRDGSSELSADDRSVLEQIAGLQRTYGGVVSVVGHASMGTGAADHTQQQVANQRISEARANAVAYQLLNYGVPPNAIRTAAVGDAHLLYSEAMPNGEAGNRRVEVYLSAY